MILNVTRNIPLARRSARAVSFWSRFIGLMGKKSFPENYDALIFEKCDSIHCFFMYMAIDVIFLDKEGKVVKCCHKLKPWHLAFGGRRSCHCVELPAGSLEQSGTMPGDQLLIKQSPASL